MARRISSISLETAHVIQEVTRGDLSPLEGMENLRLLADKAESNVDFDFIRMAQEGINELTVTLQV